MQAACAREKPLFDDGFAKTSRSTDTEGLWTWKCFYIDSVKLRFLQLGLYPASLLSYSELDEQEPIDTQLSG